MDKEKIDKILQLIKQDEYRAHFFKELSEAKNPIHWLEILKKEGYFFPDKNPKPVEDKDRKGFYSIPRWDVLGFLENVSKYNSKNPDEKITALLLEIIGEYIKYQSDSEKRIDNYITDWYILKVISNLPADRISTQHIDFLKLALNSKWGSTLIQSDIGKMLLPRLLEKNAKELTLKLMGVLFDFYEDKERGNDEYWFNELLEKNKAIIIKNYPAEISKKITDKIREITVKDKGSFNIVWIPAIEDHPQVHFSQKYECQMVRFLRDALKEFPYDKLKDIVKSLLAEEHSIFKRIGVYLINIRYDDFKELFWSLEQNPLDSYELTHEIYELLKDNSHKFESSEIDKIINWIETKEFASKEEAEIDKYVVYWKKWWYSALLNSTDEKIKEKYTEYEKSNPTKIEHPGFLTWSETFMGHRSPDDFQLVLKKGSKEIAEYLNSFVETGDPRTPSKEGLADELSTAVSTNPIKFSEKLSPFLSANEVYVHSIIRGFEDALKKEKDIDWGSLLKFIHDFIDKPEFWSKNYERGFNYRDWIIARIASLIEEGARNTKHSFDDSNNVSAKKILFKLDEKATSPFFKSEDIVMAVLNSVKGSIYSALMMLSLKIAQTKKEETTKWDEEIKNLFSKHLDSPSEELLVVIGKYLPYINTMDSEWLTDNIDKILNKNKQELWACTMTSYLYYSSTLYKNIYILLTKHEDYEKAIKTSLMNKSSDDGVVQHICVAYLNDMENMSSGLFLTLLNNKDPAQFNEIIRFFWALRKEELDEDKKAKIKPLWKKIFEICSQEKNNNSKFYETLAKLPEWLVLVDKIDEEIFKMVKDSVKHIKKAYDTWFLVEYLANHVTKSPKYVGRILLELLENQVYPIYKQESIITIVSELYTYSEKELADRICNAYLSNGYYFLKEIFDRNQKGNRHAKINNC